VPPLRMAETSGHHIEKAAGRLEKELAHQPVLLYPLIRI
jgi:hypothetical protein